MRPNRFAGCPQPVMGKPDSLAPCRPSSSCALLRLTNPVEPRRLGSPPPTAPQHGSIGGVETRTWPPGRCRACSSGGEKAHVPDRLDWVVCRVTTRPLLNSRKIALAPPDLAAGRLNERGWVGGPDRMMAMNERILGNTVARLTDAKTAEVLAAIRSFL